MTSPFSPGQLGQLRLRNRVIKSATYEGMSPRGMPTPALIELHRALAAGGVGMTTLAYCAVHDTGRTFADQLVLTSSCAAALRPLVDAVHAENAMASLQLAHAGGFSKDLAHRRRQPSGPRGPSFALNRYGMLSGMPFVRAMSRVELEGTIEHFAQAACRAKTVGFDAIELHLGHGYLLSQFLSPALNHRRDEYGGSFENRLRLPLAVVDSVRRAVGSDFPILIKTNLRDHVRGGVELDDAIEICRALDERVDAIVLSGGLVSHSAFYLLRGRRPLRSMIDVERSFAQRTALRLFGRLVIEELPFEELFFLELAKRVRRAVAGKLVLLGGVVSRDNLQTAMDEGFDFVAVGRALIENPNFVRDVQQGRLEKSPCDHCNECVAEMDRNGLRCVLPAELRSPSR